MTMESRVVLAQFFDDVRQEVGNKLSLIGCYTGGEMVFEKLPAIAPKLFAYITAIAPLDQPFEKLCIRASINGDMLGTLEVPPEQLNPSTHPQIARPGASRFFINVVMAFSPLHFPEQCTLTIVAETERGEVQAGSLFVHAKEQASPDT